MKNAVWDKHVGQDKAVSSCLVCKTNKIHIRSFDCGHIIPESKGGETNINNLLPICKCCNSSMGTKNLIEFRDKYFGEVYSVSEELKKEKMKGHGCLFSPLSLTALIYVGKFFSTDYKGQKKEDVILSLQGRMIDGGEIDKETLKQDEIQNIFGYFFRVTLTKKEWIEKLCQKYPKSCSIIKQSTKIIIDFPSSEICDDIYEKIKKIILN